MTWQNPVALSGLLLLAAPIIAHLFGRRKARVAPFPTLRFVDHTRLTPVRISRPTDLVLLTLRMLIIAVAAIALAGPQLAVPAGGMSGSAVARVILVDSSTSMHVHYSGSVRTAFDSARTVAQALADSAATSRIVVTSQPGDALRAAAEWLASVHDVAKREMVVLSDFQVGVVDSATLAGVPANVGVQFRQFATALDSTPAFTISGSGAPLAMSFHADSAGTVVRYGMRSPATESRATGRPIAAGKSGTSGINNVDTAQTFLRIHAADGPDRIAIVRELIASSAEVTVASRDSVGAMATTTTPIQVSMVFPNAPDAAAILAGVRPLRTAILGELALQVATDEEVMAAAERALPAASRDTEATRRAGTLLVLMRNADGMPLAFAGEDSSRSNHLVVISRLDLLSPATVVLATALRRHAGDNLDVREFDFRYTSPSILKSFERAATASQTAGDNNNGRWLWAVVLLLLGIETLLRRQTSSTSVASERLSDKAA